MRAYFSSRKGELPPQNALLHVRKFDGEKHYLGEVAWQRELPEARGAKIVKKTFLPEKEQWIYMVKRAREIAPKVVLSRMCILELDHAPDPFAIAAALPSEGAYVFCIDDGESAFLGASPERLLSRVEHTYYTDAMAATRPRAANSEEDLALEQELLSSKKDLLEFGYVLEYLQPFSFGPIKVHKTSTVQHLHAEGTALLSNTTDDELIDQIHPTPALCGTPKTLAKQAIETLEPFSRFLYGGVVGWSTDERAEYAVAIRSCLLKGNQAILFSGAGIVEGSNPDKEWEELNHKIRPYERIFTH